MGVAHRDLKPENILLSIDENSPDNVPTVKIADFGLAKMGKQYDDAEANSILIDASRHNLVVEGTALRSMVGTPQYLAPEIVCQTAQKPGYGKPYNCILSKAVWADRRDSRCRGGRR